MIQCSFSHISYNIMITIKSQNVKKDRILTNFIHALILPPLPLQLQAIAEKDKDIVPIGKTSEVS